MSPTEQSTQIPSQRTGIFATLAAYLRLPRSGAPSSTRHLGACAALSLTLAAVAALLFASAATADTHIGGGEGLAASAAGGISTPLGLAVSTKEGGDVYVADAAPNQRIDQFEPNGTFVRAFGWGVVPGAAAGTGNLTAASTSVTNATTTSGRFIQGQLITGPGIPPGTQIEKVTATELKLSNPPNASTTAAALSVAAGPGNIPTDERQQLTVRATGGVFGLTFSSPKPNPAGTERTIGAAVTATTSAGSSVLTSLAILTGTGNLTAGSKTVAVQTHLGAFSKGQAIVGVGIPASTTVVDVNEALGTLTLSANATVSATDVALSATPTATGTTVSGSSTVAALTGASRFSPGEAIAGAGIPAGATVTAVDLESKSLTLSAGATASASDVALTARPSLFAGEGVSGPGIPPGTTIVSVAANGDLTLSANATSSATGVGLGVGIPYNASAAQLQAMLGALSNIGPGSVSVSGGPGDATGTSPYLITFGGRFADANVRTLSPADLGLSGGNPSSAATLTTPAQGGGVLETCTAVCLGESIEEGGESGQGSEPGQLRWSDEIAVDNDPASSSYGDVYLLDQRNFRVEKYSPAGKFELMLGGEVDKTTHANVCTAADLTAGDTCGAGLPGTGPAHFYESGSLSWASTGSNSIAVGPNGTVYVGDYGRVQEFKPDGTFLGEFALPGEATVTGTGNLTKGSPTVTSVTTTSGAFAVGQPITGQGIPPATNILAVGAGTLTLSSPATEAATGVALSVNPQFVTALALDSAGNLFERSAVYGNVVGIRGLGLVSQVPGVREYNPAHTLLRTFDTESGSEPTHIALDSSGDLFLSDRNGGEITFRAFKPDGTLSAEFTSDQVANAFQETGGPPAIEQPGTAEVHGVALGDAADRLYATSRRTVTRFEAGRETEDEFYIAVIPPPKPGPPLVSDEEVTDIQPKTATLHAVVNPSEFDTEYHFEYTTTDFTACGTPANLACQSTASKDLGSVNRKDSVQAAISGLTTNTTYHWRVVATSECEPIANPGHICVTAPEQTFETLPAVSVRDFTTQTVGPELLTLKAELNPNGSATHYTIRYGTDAAYSCEPGNTCSAEGNLPVGSEFVKVEREGKEGITFSGLQPNTTYHYQLIASNGNGEVKTADQTFTTELSPAEERAAEDCPNGSNHGAPNSTLREENNSLSLPDCRAYEQTTAVNKEGSEAFPVSSLAPGGDRLAYQSEGVFAGALAAELTVNYLAQRTASGWVTQPTVGRGPAGTEPTMEPANLLFSPELDRWLFLEVPAFDSEEGFYKAKSAYLSMGFADGTYLLHASPTVSLVEGEARQLLSVLHANNTLASDDLSHIYVVQRSRLLPGDPRPDDYREGGGDRPRSTRIYELSGLGGPSPTIKLAAEVPLGLHHLGGGSLGDDGCAINSDIPVDLFQHRGERLVSADGSTIVYTAPIEHVAGQPCGQGTPNPIAFFAHHGEASVQLNAPPPAQCHSPSPCATAAPTDPNVVGISPDGTRAWFSTTQPLIDSDTDNTRDLYMAKLQAGQLVELVQVSAGQAAPGHPTPGTGAGVQGVFNVSPDGSHVAFVATGVLTTESNPSTGQSAVQGADNLYVYDAAGGETKFLARQCSSTGKSGSFADPSCFEGSAEGGWRIGTPDQEVSEKYFTPDGRYFLFTSNSRLTPDDTDTAQDLYRYDFQTGQLIRVSVGRNGNDANGNDNAYSATLTFAPDLGGANNLAEDTTRAITADGSTVIFQTFAPLVSHDTNEAEDVYEWEESGHGTCHQAAGCISLVSDGLDPHGAVAPVISASGRDIVFHTQRNEIPADTDGVGDVYDARVNGGFHRPPLPEICEGREPCSGPPTPPPAPPKITTENETGGNGLQQLHCGKGRHRVTRHGQVRCVRDKSHKKHHHKAKHKRAANTNRGGGK